MRNAVLKNQVILGTVNAGKEGFADAIRTLGAAAQRWPDALRSLITGRYPLVTTVNCSLGSAVASKMYSLWVRLRSP